MEQEIELKLLAPNNAGDIIERDILPCLTGQSVKSNVELNNYYYDTPDRHLRKNDMGLRIRGDGKYLEQTLKTSGKSLGGLQQRPEYNVVLSATSHDIKEQELMPNLALFDASAWPSNFPLDRVQQQLSTLFLTRFERTCYLLDLHPSCQIEMVWDRGYVTANGQSKVICEIELELKKGKVTDLFDLAQLLLSFMYLSVGNDSKAARGYRLADLLPVEEPALNLQDLLGDDGVTQVQFYHNVSQLLTFMQYALEKLSHVYTHHIGRRLLECLTSLVSITGLYNAEHNSEMVTSILHRVTNLHTDWATLFAQIELIPSNKVPVTKVAGVLFQSQVTQLQLDITQLLLQEN